MRKRLAPVCAALMLLCGCGAQPVPAEQPAHFSVTLPAQVRPSDAAGYAFRDGDILLDYREVSPHCTAQVFLEQYVSPEYGAEPFSVNGLACASLAMPADPSGAQLQYAAAGSCGHVLFLTARTEREADAGRAKELLDAILQSVTYTGEPLKAGSFISRQMIADYPAEMAAEAEKSGERCSSVTLTFAEAKSIGAHNCLLEISADLDGDEPEQAAEQLHIS